MILRCHHKVKTARIGKPEDIQIDGGKYCVSITRIGVVVLVSLKILGVFKELPCVLSVPLPTLSPFLSL
jgi:hypothetical protein